MTPTFHGKDTTVGDFGNREGRLGCINAIIAKANDLWFLERLGSRKLRMRRRLIVPAEGTRAIGVR